MTKRKYWYEFWFEECVLCGREHKYKERRYTRKPKDYTKRFHYSQFYCWCGG